MADGFTAYEKGLEGKDTQAKDKKAATTKAPAKVIQTPEQREAYWIPKCSPFLRDQTPPIDYLKHTNVSTTQLMDIQQAINYVKDTSIGNELLKFFEQRKDELKIVAHFFDARADYPYNDASQNESGHARIATSVAATPIVISVSVFVAKRPPECIADTLFHELAHAWFLASYSGYNEVAGTGHDSSASITIDPNGSKTYTGYDPKFKKVLQRFDADLTKLGVKVCRE